MATNLNLNDFNMDEKQKEEFYSINKEINEYNGKDYDENDSYVVDALYDLWRDLSWLLTKTLIKNTDNIRKYKEWFDWATYIGNYNLIHLLLKYSADCCIDNCEALAIACGSDNRNNMDIVKLLLDKGSYINSKALI